MSLRETLVDVAGKPAEQFSVTFLHTVVKQAEAELRIVDAKVETEAVVEPLPDETLDHLLKIHADLTESMGTDLDGRDFKDQEVAWLLILSSSVVHLVRDLRAIRRAVGGAR